MTSAEAPGASAPGLRAESLDRARERSSFLLVCFAIAILEAPWFALDLYSHGRFPWHALVLRLSVAVVAAGAWLVVWRAETVAVRRSAVLAAVLWMDVAIGTIVGLSIDNHHLYVMTGSVILIVSALVPWPTYMVAFANAGVVGAYVVSATSQGAIATDELIGWVAYLATLAVISACVARLHELQRRRMLTVARESELANRELAAALDELKATQARLISSEKMSAVGRLLAQLAHELNNPANVLVNTLEPLKGYLAHILDALVAGRRGDAAEVERLWTACELDFEIADTRQALADIDASVGRIVALHAELRTFLRRDAVETEIADLNDTVRSTVSLLRRGLGEGVKVSVVYGDVPPFPHRAGPLGQVVFSLIKNAIAAVGDAGEVAVTTRLALGLVEVAVEDTGPGVADALRPVLFLPLTTSKEAGQGIGMGLATSKQIALEHGGDLVLDVNYTKGARFVLRVPLSVSASQPLI